MVSIKIQKKSKIQKSKTKNTKIKNQKYKNQKTLFEGKG